MMLSSWEGGGNECLIRRLRACKKVSNEGILRVNLLNAQCLRKSYKMVN